MLLGKNSLMYLYYYNLFLVLRFFVGLLVGFFIGVFVGLNGCLIH